MSRLLVGGGAGVTPAAGGAAGGGALCPPARPLAEALPAEETERSKKHWPLVW